MTVFAAALGLAGCAGPLGDDPASKVGGFPAQGALYGAGIGAAAGCATAVVGGHGGRCLGRAAIGGALGAAAGAAAGYVVRDRNDRYAADEARLDDRLRASRQDLDAARQAADANQRVVDDRQAEIRDLRDRLARGEASRVELGRAVAAARSDVARIRQARDDVGSRVAALDTEAAAADRSGSEPPPELVARRDELRAELARLDRQLQALTGAADVAEASG